jgi:hypothetical protein
MNTNTLTLLIVVGLAVLFIGIGLLLIFLYRRNQKRASESLLWPETSGTVVHSAVSAEVSVFDNDEIQNQRQQMYSADIRYTYLIDGVEYTTKRISFAGKSSYSKQQRAEEIIAKYPQGASVRVFYNPEKNQESVLERTANGSGVLLGAGVAFLLVGVITLIVGFVLGM